MPDEPADQPTPPQRSTPSRARARRAHEVWVGLFALLAFATVIILGIVLRGRLLFPGGQTFITHVADAATLREGSPVELRGVRVGRVQRVRLGDQGVRLMLRINDGVPVPEGSRVWVEPAAVFGTARVNLVPGPGPGVLASGAVLPGDIEQGTLARADDLTSQAADVLDRASALLSPELTGHVRSSAAELRTLLETAASLMAEQSEEVRALTGSLVRSARGIERGVGAGQIERIVGRTEALLQRLDQTTAALQSSAAGAARVMDRINRGDGTLGQLTTDPTLYRNLDRAAVEVRNAAGAVRTLADDVRRNPRRYFDISVF